MAQKTVCDVCGTDIANADSDTVEYHGVSLHLTAERWEPGAWKEADICAVCFHGAAKAHDPTPQEAPARRFNWVVTLEGVKTPGPHAGFLFEDDARRFLRDSGLKGDMKPS